MFLAMDGFDRKILAELQANGRLSLTDLAERVGLTLSPCHRRVRALEEAGVILGYHAVLDPGKMGMDFAAIVFVILRDGNKQAIEAFENAVTAVPEVVQAQRLFGDPGQVLHVRTKDMEAFRQLYDDHLSRLPNVLRLTSTLVMKTIVDKQRLPF